MQKVLSPPKNVHFYKGQVEQKQGNPRIICQLLAAPSRKCLFLPKKKSTPRFGTWGRYRGPKARIQTQREPWPEGLPGKSSELADQYLACLLQWPAGDTVLYLGQNLSLQNRRSSSARFYSHHLGYTAQGGSRGLRDHVHAGSLLSNVKTSVTPFILCRCALVALFPSSVLIRFC